LKKRMGLDEGSCARCERPQGIVRKGQMENIPPEKRPAISRGKKNVFGQEKGGE